MRESDRAHALIDRLIAEEDRAPRELIEEAARLGGVMVEALRERLAGDWKCDASSGEWWMRLHAVMILGRIELESAGMLMVDFMRRMAVAEDDNLEDWLAGYWPALFANKPPGALASLCDLCGDRTLDWYVRCNALEAVVASADRQGEAALDHTLAWIAQMAAAEDGDMRYWCGDALLDHPRAAYRSLLESLAAAQDGPSFVFTIEDVVRAYEGAPRESLRHFDDPWQFYAPEVIAARQARWAREDEVGEGDDTDGEIDVPYVRELPKIGRNDPCVCGSGKKYKRCCLARLEGGS